MKSNFTSAKAKKTQKPIKPILEQVHPLVVAYREVRKLDWLVTDDIRQALSEKAMMLLLSSLGE